MADIQTVGLELAATGRTDTGWSVAPAGDPFEGRAQAFESNRFVTSVVDAHVHRWKRSVFSWLAPINALRRACRNGVKVASAASVASATLTRRAHEFGELIPPGQANRIAWNQCCSPGAAFITKELRSSSSGATRAITT